MKKKLFSLCAVFLMLALFMPANLLAVHADPSSPEDSSLTIWSTENPGANIMRTYPISGGGYIAQKCDSAWGNMRLVKYNKNNGYEWEMPIGTISKICSLPDGSFWAAGYDGAFSSQAGYIEKYTQLGVKVPDSRISFSNFAVSNTGSFNIGCNGVAVVDDGLIVSGIFSGNYDLAIGSGTQTIGSLGSNVNSVIFKIGFDGSLLMAKEFICSPNAIRINGCQKLDNGNVAFYGYTNNTSSNIPGLASMGGYDEFVLVIDGEDLSQNICTIDWVKTIHVSGNHYSLDNMRISGNKIFLYGSSDATNGLANANTRAILGPDATWGANSSILLAFDGNSQGELLFLDFQVSESSTVACSGITVDNDGSYLVLYQISKSGLTYSKLVRYSSDFELISEMKIGEESHVTSANDISKTGTSIIIVGNANYRFNTDTAAIGAFDAFIYAFGSFQAEILTAPTVADIAYTFGDIMPELQGGIASVEGVFAWDGIPVLVAGTHDYLWTFTPTLTTLEPVHGVISITVGKSVKGTPSGKLSVKSVTSVSIEFIPIDGAEYSIDGGITWQSSALFENLNPSTKYTATYRLKGDDNYETGLPAEISLIRTSSEDKVIEAWWYAIVGIWWFFLVILPAGIAIIAVIKRKKNNSNRVVDTK